MATNKIIEKIVTGKEAPSNKYVFWLDTSLNPPVLKSYVLGSGWISVTRDDSEDSAIAELLGDVSDIKRDYATKEQLNESISEVARTVVLPLNWSEVLEITPEEPTIGLWTPDYSVYERTSSTGDLYYANSNSFSNKVFTTGQVKIYPNKLATAITNNIVEYETHYTIASGVKYLSNMTNPTTSDIEIWFEQTDYTTAGVDVTVKCGTDQLTTTINLSSSVPTVCRAFYERLVPYDSTTKAIQIGNTTSQSIKNKDFIEFLVFDTVSGRPPYVYIWIPEDEEWRYLGSVQSVAINDWITKNYVDSLISVSKYLDPVYTPTFDNQIHNSGILKVETKLYEGALESSSAEYSFKAFLRLISTTEWLERASGIQSYGMQSMTIPNPETWEKPLEVGTTALIYLGKDGDTDVTLTIGNESDGTPDVLMYSFEIVHSGGTVSGQFITGSSSSDPWINYDSGLFTIDIVQAGLNWNTIDPAKGTLGESEKVDIFADERFSLNVCYYPNTIASTSIYITSALHDVTGSGKQLVCSLELTEWLSFNKSVLEDIIDAFINNDSTSNP